MSKVKKNNILRKIRLLVADNVPLHPPVQGGPMRIYNLYSPLPEKRFEISYIGVVSHPETPPKARIKETIFLTSRYSSINSILVRAFGQNKRYLRGGSIYDLGMRLYLKFNPRFKREIRTLADKSDILISSHPWLFTFLKRFKDKVLIYDSHNCEYALLKKRMDGFLAGKIMLFLTKRVEREACQKSDLILACSETDKQQLMELYGINADKIELLPNSTDTKLIRPTILKGKSDAKKEFGLAGRKTVLFIATNFFANNSAADFIVDELAKKMPEFTFMIVGTVKTHFDRTRAELPGNVVLFGRVHQEKLLSILRATDIAINPVMTGSGICIKNLDYMAAGLPIVSTPIGMRGIDAKNNMHAVICEPSSFRKSLKRIDYNPQFQALLSRNTRKLAKQEFDAEVISRRLAIVLERCVKRTKKA
ncbi:MAG: glycosyltransferase [archaeon]